MSLREPAAQEGAALQPLQAGQPSPARHPSPARPARSARSVLAPLMLAVFAVVLLSLWTLRAEGELGLGRKPWQNLQRTVAEMSQPSFLRLWFGNERLESRDADGRVLRVENQRLAERDYLQGLARALWTTVRIATLGTVLAALLALPLGLLAARNLHAPRALQWGSKGVLDSLRAIHTLVFGLFFVGIVGLGATAGILAVAAHSAGSLGKLLAEAIESLDMQPVNAVRATGATPGQVFFLGVWPAVLPQFVSQTLYVWEFNIRDSTILGLVGAGGLGLLLSEALSLFHWSRLGTLLLAIILMVTAFDALSRALRTRIV